MKETAEEIENEILDLFLKIASNFGQDDVSTKIISILLLSPKEVSMDKLMKKTGYSAATISNKTKMCSQMGIVKRIKKPGTKKAFFYMEKDIKKVTRETLGKIIDLKFNPMKSSLPGIIERYKKIINKSDKESIEKLGILENILKDILFIEQMYKEMIVKLKD